MPDRTASWLRQGYEHPAPWAGQSLPELWLDDEVTFLRDILAPSPLGGFDADRGSNTTLLTTLAHTEIVTEQSMGLTDQGLNNTQLRYYQILIPTPAVGSLPRKGDKATWTDRAGRTITVAVRRVDLPEGGTDHVEIDTEYLE